MNYFYMKTEIDVIVGNTRRKYFCTFSKNGQKRSKDNAPNHRFEGRPTSGQQSLKQQET